jgi:hypothetical protein
VREPSRPMFGEGRAQGGVFGAALGPSGVGGAARADSSTRNRRDPTEWPFSGQAAPISLEKSNEGERISEGVRGGCSARWAARWSGGFKSLRCSDEGHRIRKRDETSRWPDESSEDRVLAARRDPKGMRRNTGPQSMGAAPKTNRSAKGGTRSSLHYGGEGVLIHPPYQGVCGRHGVEDQCVTPGELAELPGGTGRSDPISESEKGSGAGRVVGRSNSTRSAMKIARPRKRGPEWVREVDRRRRSEREGEREEQGRGGGPVP